MESHQGNNSLIINRLTALWALNECGLGGFMHAFSSPFTGIIVGGISILMVTLIASYANHVQTSVIKALSIVLIVKLSVSPHSPLPAYFAVSFQGLLGIMLFRLLSVNALSIIVFAVTTFLESALQKLLTLTIIYGLSLWEAVDSYISWISLKLNFIELTLSSKHLILAFLSFYALAGLFVGVLIFRVYQLVHAIKVPDNFNPIIRKTSIMGQKKTSRSKRKPILFWLVILVLILVSLFVFNDNPSRWSKGLYLIARSLIVIGVWYFIVGPALLKLLNKFLKKKGSKYQSDIQLTLEILPYLKSIILYAWEESKKLKGLKRIQYFISRSIVYSFHFNLQEQ